MLNIRLEYFEILETLSPLTSKFRNSQYSFYSKNLNVDKYLLKFRLCHTISLDEYI
jgi:hypothetical protein